MGPLYTLRPISWADFNSCMHGDLMQKLRKFALRVSGLQSRASDKLNGGVDSENVTGQGDARSRRQPQIYRGYEATLSCWINAHLPWRVGVYRHSYIAACSADWAL